MSLKEYDVVLCTVTKIEGATVFVDIEGNGSGSIAMSEVAAGRIRNLREYVTPNKKIVCKVLRVEKEHIELSLRRVTGKERDDVLEKYKREKTAQTMLSNALKNSPETLKKILAEYSYYDFISAAKANPTLITKFANGEALTNLQRILVEKKEKEKTSKRIFTLRSDSSSGLEDIKKIISCENVDIHYLGSSQFSVWAKGKEFKEANQHVESALALIQKRAKELKAHFEMKVQ
jgi:translation initiation factor 2 alpha subunit (eIF-2alpha)